MTVYDEQPPTPARPALESSRHTVETVRRTIETMSHGLDRDMFEKLLTHIDEVEASALSSKSLLETELAASAAFAKWAADTIKGMNAEVDRLRTALEMIAVNAPTDEQIWSGGVRLDVKGVAREALARSQP